MHQGGRWRRRKVWEWACVCTWNSALPSLPRALSELVDIFSEAIILRQNMLEKRERKRNVKIVTTSREFMLYVIHLLLCFVYNQKNILL